MRKLLMATAAMVGASLGMANASQIELATPPGLTQSSQGTNLPVYAAQAPSPAAPQPGQIVVRIDLRENVYAVGGWSSLDNVAGNKQQPYGIIGYPRFYLGFDGKAANGLTYGMFWEIRNGSNSNGAPNGNLGSGTPGNTGASGNSQNQTLFWRRNFGYVGLPTLGTLRIGETDGPMSLFLIGTFDDFATGGWNGDINDWIQGGSYGETGAFPNWPFFDVGAEYTTAKAVYLSPAFAGFDFGASFEPSTANIADSQTCPNTAQSGLVGTSGSFVGCSSQSTSNAANDLQRRRNTLEAAVRYRGAFGGFGVAASVIGAYGGHVNPGFNNPGLGGGSFTDIHGHSITLHSTSSFQNVAVGDAGLAVTFAGVTVGGNLIGGQYNGQFAPLNSGGSDSVAWIGGVEYTVGPMIVGGAYFKWKYQGYWTLPGQQTDQGIQLGFTYNIAPGLALLGEYLYGQRYKGNFDFSAGAPGANFNNVHSQVAGLGLQFRW